MIKTEQFSDNSIKPPKRLFKSVMDRLKIEKLLGILKKRISFSSIILVFSIFLIVSAFMIFRNDLTESETGSLISLLFSDTFEVLIFLKYFLWAFFESIPVLFLALVFFAVSVLMISLRFLVKYYFKIVELINKIKKQ
jgi:hypothetical protein